MRVLINCMGLENSPNWGDNIIFWSLEEYFKRMNYQYGSWKYIFGIEEACSADPDTINIFLNNASKIILSHNKNQSVFVATLLQARHNSEVFRQSLKQYDLPILCRDRRTVTYLKHYGYDAVLWGCNTLLLPKRAHTDEQKYIYGVDVPESLYKFMPKDIKTALIDLGSSEHEPTVLENGKSSDIIKYNFEFSKNKINKIKETAKMVITSRLHVAAPCLAMGVPVIFAKSYVDHRYDVLEPFIPLYGEGDFASINWQPEAIDMEYTKDNMCYMLKAVLDEVERRSEVKKKFSSMAQPYNNRYAAPHRFKPVVQANYGYFVYNDNPFDSYNFFERIIGRKLKDVDLFYYGCGHIGKHFFNSTYTLIKQARSFAFVDNNPKFEGLDFEGYKIIKSSELANYDRDNLVIIITANGFGGGAAYDMANELSKEYGFVDGKDYFLYEFLMVTLTEYNFNDPFAVTTRLVSKVATSHDIFKVLS